MCVFFLIKSWITCLYYAKLLAMAQLEDLGREILQLRQTSFEMQRQPTRTQLKRNRGVVPRCFSSWTEHIFYFSSSLCYITNTHWITIDVLCLIRVVFVLQLRVQSVNPEMKNSLVLTVIYTIEYFRNIYEKRESLRNVIIVNHGAVSTFRAGTVYRKLFFKFTL